jgi:trimeric autotransporter adhesin
MFSKKQWICAAVFVQSLSAIAQVSINNDNAAPHASAMLDVKSTNKGMLVPRMTTAQRNNIAAPATGLLVFDSDLNRFYFFNGTNWGEIGAITPQFIADADGNTSVHTETNSNEDVIRFKIGGNEKWRMIGERLENNSSLGNTFLGYNTGLSNTTGFENTFVGLRAGQSNTTGICNTFLGYKAGLSNTTGVVNTFIGYNTGLFNTTGTANTFVGYKAGESNTTGNANVFLSYLSGQFNTTGNYNIFLGNHSGNYNTTGNENIFLGYATGYLNTTGSYNLVAGNFAGNKNTTGYYNVFLGHISGISNTTGGENTFLGCAAGRDNTTGSFNTFLGRNAALVSNYSNAIAIGSNSAISQDNEISIGNSSSTSAKIPVSWTVTSDARFKKDIESNVAGLSFIRLLRPVTYHYDVAGLARHLREMNAWIPPPKP